MKKVLILSTKEDVINFNNLDFFKKISSEDVVITLHKDAEDKLEELNFKQYKTNRNYEDDDSYNGIDIDAMNFGRKWFNEIRDLMLYDKIILGECVRVSYLFSEIYKYVRLLKSIIKKENPNKIILAHYKNYVGGNIILEDNDNSVYEILKEIIKNKSIELNVLEFQYKRSVNKDSFFKKPLSKIQNSLLFKLKFDRNKKVLMIGSKNQFSNIISELDDMNYTVIRGGNNFGLSLLDNRGKYYITFKYFKNRYIRKKLSSAKKLLEGYYKQIESRNDFKDKFTYEGVSYWNIFRKKVEFLYQNEFLNAVKNIEVINFLSKKNYLDLLVVSNDINTFEKTLVLAAKNVNKKTMVIQHGATTHPVSFLPLTADYIAVWGKIAKDWLIKVGKVDDKRILVTGCGRFDSYFSQCKMTKEEVYNFFKIPKDKKIVLYAPPFHQRYGHFPNFQLNVDQIVESYKEIFENIKLLKDFHLVIKLHPSDRLIDLPTKVAKQLNFKQYSLIQDFDVHSLINASEIIITSWSTVGYEAMLLKRPVIVLDLTKDRRSDTGNYVKHNSAIGVYKKSSLYKEINKIYFDKDFRNKLIKNSQVFLNDSLDQLDGKASNRIAKAIDEIISKRK